MEARVRAAPMVGHGERVEGVRLTAWLFVLQRASAAVLALCVLVHLATILYAVRHGLSAQAIVTRMRASVDFPCVVVATGGLAPLIAKDSKTIEHTDEMLTLTGLGLLWERNR